MHLEYRITKCVYLSVNKCVCTWILYFGDMFTPTLEDYDLW